jgi:hypothetical protein
MLQVGGAVQRSGSAIRTKPAFAKRAALRTQARIQPTQVGFVRIATPL